MKSETGRRKERKKVGPPSLRGKPDSHRPRPYLLPNGKKRNCFRLRFAAALNESNVLRCSRASSLFVPVIRKWVRTLRWAGTAEHVSSVVFQMTGQLLFFFFPSFQNGLIISASSIQQILFFSSPQHVFNRMKTRALNQTE